MSVFDKLGRGQTSAHGVNPQQALAHLREDPIGVLKQAGLSVPNGMNDPHQIVNHLVQSGQVPQARLQMAQRMVGMMGR